MKNNKNEQVRRWVVMWMYAVVIGHFIVGLMLPWIGNLSALDAYLRIVEAGFWPDTAPVAARQQQIWWMSLFGPTIQSLSLWMGVLVYLGDRQRNAVVWAWLAIGIVVWGPQDIWISLRADTWIHAGIDCFAMATMLPPLCWLWRHDRQMPSSAGERAV